MRDLQHWKDRVELRLDGRQVFFLFFGGAVIACLLFALGVMTGRRLEARAIALDAPASDDPLAALDQLGDLEDEELTYHRALTKERSPSALQSTPVSEADRGKPTPKAPAAKPAAPAAKPAAPVAKPVAPAAKPSAPAPRAVPPPARAAAHADASDVVDAAVQHFTLQLSAFTARHDADDFMHRAQAAGYQAFVVPSEQPGRGTVYRVRVGDYRSRDAALADKGPLDRKLNVTAYLARM